MKNNELLKKQIVYRSTHRGNKEMDLLLGSFVKKNIDLFSDSELYDLNKLMLTDDEILQRWYFNKEKQKLIPDNNVTTMLKNFRL